PAAREHRVRGARRGAPQHLWRKGRLRQLDVGHGARPGGQPDGRRGRRLRRLVARGVLMPYIQSNGLKFHVQVLGGGADDSGAKRPKVVMLHGLVIDNLSSWFYTLGHPMAQQVDAHLVDLRGHGRTEIAEEGYHVVDHVQDLLGLLDAWEIDEPVHFFGNSFGCVVGLALAREYPEKVASLFLIEAHFSTPGWGEKMAGTLALAAFGLDEVAVREYLATEADRKTSRLAKRTEKLFFGTSLIEDLKTETPIDWLDEIKCPVF